MSRLILAFARHADYEQLEQTPSAHQPFALTDKGREQSYAAASKFSAFIKQQGWQLLPEIDCSQMLRSWQTATVYSEVLTSEFTQSFNVHSFDALAERSVGAVANLTEQQITQIIHDDPRYYDLPDDWKADSDFCLPFQGAESLMTAGKRVAEHLSKSLSTMARQSEPQVKLVVGHGASFRHAAYHLGVLNREQIAQLSMFHAEPIFLERHEDASWQHIAGEWKQRAFKSDGMD